MKSSVALLTTIIILSAGCSSVSTEKGSNPAKVTIKTVDNKAFLYVNDQSYFVQGVGMGGVGENSGIQLLKSIGGNAIRTWDARNARQILDSAAIYGLMVALGLDMGKELHGFDYEDSTAVQEQFDEMKLAVDTYKNHPNLLCWVAGNELNLLFGDSGLIPVNPKTYLALNDIVNYIHAVDKNHPVTTTFAGYTKTSVDYALTYCPDLDFLSFQVYGELGQVPALVQQQGIELPYLITEYGPVGHWERPTTTWGREMEETSQEKANGLAGRMQRAFLKENTGKNMGGFAFLWGQKQERTPTWYGMFIKSGEATAVVDELALMWTGSYPVNRAPAVDSMVLDNKKGIENIYLNPNATYSAYVFGTDPENDSLTYQWVIMREVQQRSEGGAFEQEPASVEFEIKSNQNGSLEFIAPEVEGDYRLFSYTYDGKGKVGTSNVPFYVKSSN